MSKIDFDAAKSIALYAVGLFDGLRDSKRIQPFETEEPVWLDVRLEPVVTEHYTMPDERVGVAPGSQCWRFSISFFPTMDGTFYNVWVTEEGKVKIFQDPF